MKRLSWIAGTCIVLLFSLIPLGAYSSSSLSSPALASFAGTAPDAVLATMQRELKRATTSLAKSDPSPYFLSYAVSDIDATVIVASNGSVVFSTSVVRRQGDVMTHVGSLALDNTHNQSRESGIVSGSLPLDNDTDAMARVLWQLTDRGYEQDRKSVV